MQYVGCMPGAGLGQLFKAPARQTASLLVSTLKSITLTRAPLFGDQEVMVPVTGDQCPSYRFDNLHRLSTAFEIAAQYYP